MSIQDKFINKLIEDRLRRGRTESSVQDKFINKLIKEKKWVSIFVDGGIQQQGVIIEHDKDAILLKGEKSVQTIYKNKSTSVCLYGEL